MRSMTVLKISLLCALGVFLIFLFFNFGRKEAKNPEKLPSGKSRKVRSARLLSESHVFDFTKTEAGKKVFRIMADRVSGYEDGLQELEEVELRLFNTGAGDVNVAAGKALYREKDQVIKLSEGVELEDNNGLTVKTESLDYIGGSVVGREEVIFTRGKYRGRSDGMEYVTENRQLLLEGGIEVEGERITLTGERMSYSAATGNISMDGEPRIVIKGEGILDCDRLDARMEGDSMEYIRAGGNVFFRRQSKGGNFRAPRVEMFFEEDGQSPSQMDVKGKTQIEFLDTAGERRYYLETVGMDAIFQFGKLKQIEGKSNSFLEIFDMAGNVVEKARCRTFLAFYNPGEAEFYRLSLLDDVLLESPDYRGECEEAVYYRDRNYALLRKDARIEYGDYEVSADRIRYDGGAGKLFAERDVKTRLGADSLEGLPFEGGKPVHITSDTLELVRAEELALFTGNVAARQEKDVIVGDRLEMDRLSGLVRVKGRVTTRVLLEDTLVPVIVSSENMIYYRDAERADYFPQVTLSREEIRISCNKMSAYFEKGLDRIEMNGDVKIRGPEKKGTGDRGVYTVSDESMELYSDNGFVVVEDIETGESVSGQKLTYTLKGGKISIGSDQHGRTISSSNQGLKGKENAGP